VNATAFVVEQEGLLERSEQLASLANAFAAADETRRGRVVLVSGEAGIGKTSLVRRFCRQAAGVERALWGTCDVLFAPRPLGPVVDIAEQTGGELAELVGRGAVPYEVAVALGRVLEHGAPSILVLEDVHAADEATLDVLRLLAARLDGFPALVIVTYRDVGLDRWHPLRLVLGEVASVAPVERLRLVPLSQDAVTQLAASRAVAADELYRKTSGNPFFVAEVLAAGDEEIPATVRDAVLGRAARLSGPARMLLDAVAVAGKQAELWLLQALAGNEVERLDECVGSGIVVPQTRAVRFAHELARLAVENSIPLQRRLALHAAALAALGSPPEGTPDLARLAHHAQATGDPQLVLKFAPPAAAHASSLGAHREAAIHYGEALRFADTVPVDARAELYSGRAMESFLTVELEDATAAIEQALRCYDELGGRPAQGAALTFLALLHWEVGSLPQARVTAQRALDRLEGIPGPALVDAYRMMSILVLAAEDPPAAMTWAERATDLAEQLGDIPSQIAALQMVGWVEFYAGAPGGIDKLNRALELALAEGVEDLVATTYTVIVRTACRLRDYNLAAPYIAAGLDYCSTRDIDLWRHYLLGWQAKVLLAQGLWTEAARTAMICLEKECPFARIHALVALGLVRARRGDPNASELLDEALALAEPRDELQWIGPVATARAEVAWLEGRHDDIGAALAPALGFPMRRGDPYATSLAYWRRRAGDDVEPPPDDGSDPLVLEMAGEWATARDRWAAIGWPYEAAVAVIEADDEPALQQALAELQDLGARPATAMVARKLRGHGALNLPRGHRPTTRANPAGLTPRELGVLTLLIDGLRNAEIADRLFVSEKTVAHHVSAILRKLGVANRVQAVTEAARLGITNQ
jgi:DNA-binding CsgD family transcriptional regulator/tetratricopeptide (TPR) repeat protein